jgi:hypothetical protein
MKNQLNNPDELKYNNTSIAVSKKPTYIYTEEDLGEGILDIGITS